MRENRSRLVRGEGGECPRTIFQMSIIMSATCLMCVCETSFHTHAHFVGAVARLLGWRRLPKHGGSCASPRRGIVSGSLTLASDIVRLTRIAAIGFGKNRFGRLCLWIGFSVHLVS